MMFGTSTGCAGKEKVMQRDGCVIGLLALTALMTACSSAPPPAPDTRDADIRAVKEVEAAWSRDAGTKDPEKFASYFADDGAGLYPGMAVLNGRQAIKTGMAPLMADPNFSLTFQSSRAEASKGSDLVYTLGSYTATMTNPKTKKPMTDKGKYLTIYRKQADGSWKVVADTFNSDSAM
jgi:uncharacterized protein (TIGR02246 family)